MTSHRIGTSKENRKWGDLIRIEKVLLVFYSLVSPNNMPQYIYPSWYFYLTLNTFRRTKLCANGNQLMCTAPASKSLFTLMHWPYNNDAFNLGNYKILIYKIRIMRTWKSGITSQINWPDFLRVSIFYFERPFQVYKNAFPGALHCN